MFLLSLDIDGTQHFHQHRDCDTDSEHLKACLERLRQELQVIIIHNTGRPYPWKHYGDADEHFLNPIIAEGDYLIHSAGTKIECTDSDLSRNWQERVNALVSLDDMAFLKGLLGRKDIRMHPETEDNVAPHKISCLVDPQQQATKIQVVQGVIDEYFSGKFEVFYWNPWTIDITPKGANKLDALLYLREVTGLQDLSVVCAGDSMNDFPVLSHEKFFSIVTGNASAELRSAIQVQRRDNVYIANMADKGPAAVLAGLKDYLDRYEPYLVQKKGLELKL